MERGYSTIESESLEEAIARRKKGLIRNKDAVRDIETARESFLDKLYGVSALLRWTRVIRLQHSEAVSVNLIRKWAQGTLNMCLQMWQEETKVLKQNARWAPADIILKKTKRVKREAWQRHESSSESSSSDDNETETSAEAGNIFIHTYINTHKHTS
jgi:hypothetical protein